MIEYKNEKFSEKLVALWVDKSDNFPSRYALLNAIFTFYILLVAEITALCYKRLVHKLQLTETGKGAPAGAHMRTSPHHKHTFTSFLQHSPVILLFK